MQNEEIFDKFISYMSMGAIFMGENWGRNSRLDNLQAAFLQYNLGSYGVVIERRRKVAPYMKLV